MQFVSSDFYFNDISSTSKNVCLISFDDAIIKDYGSIYSNKLKSEKNINNSYFYTEDGNEGAELTLNIMKKGNGNAGIWSNEDIRTISEWLITDNFVPFVSQDDMELIFYVKCTSIKKMMTPNKLGYLECVFTIYGGSPIRKINSKLDSGETITIVNPTNTRSNTMPKIAIINLGNAATVNKVDINGKVFEIKGLKTNESVMIDNQLCTVFSGGINKIELCNRQWLTFVPGSNIIKAEGNCKVIIKAQAKVGV